MEIERQARAYWDLKKAGEVGRQFKKDTFDMCLCSCEKWYKMGRF